jgi:type II secretory pathway component PulK
MKRMWVAMLAAVGMAVASAAGTVSAAGQQQQQQGQNGAQTPPASQLVKQKTGGFKKVEELMNIQGIGEKVFLRLKPLVTVTPPKTTER